MTGYKLEAIGSTLKGIVTYGSRRGYEGADKLTLEATVSLLDQVNLDIIASGASPIPCIVREGCLIGRTSTSAYQEGVFTFEFSWSPRAPPIDRKVFYQGLIAYAHRLGEQMGQERVYVEFDGRTEVFKRNA